MASKKNGIKRCDCCGKMISNGKPVIYAEHAIDYVKKQGFEVTEIRMPWQKSSQLKIPLRKVAPVAAMFIFMLSLSMVSAYNITTGLNVDFTQDVNIWVLFGSFALVGILLYFKSPAAASLILLLDGFLMLMNGINILWSVIPIVFAVLIAGGKK